MARLRRRRDRQIQHYLERLCAGQLPFATACCNARRDGYNGDFVAMVAFGFVGALRNAGRGRSEWPLRVEPIRQSRETRAKPPKR